MLITKMATLRLLLLTPMMSLLFSTPVWGWQAPAPLSMAQIEALIDLQGMPDAALAGEIRDRHLAFSLTRSIVDALRSRGAGPQTVAALETLLPPPPTIDQFYADRMSVPVGGSATLRWSVSGAERVSLAPGFGALAFAGQKVLQLTQDIQLILTAEGPGGSTSRTLTLVVISPLPPSVVPDSRETTIRDEFGNKANRLVGTTVVADHKHTFGSCRGQFEFGNDALTFTSHSHTLSFSRATVSSIFSGISGRRSVTKSGKVRGVLPSGWVTIITTNGKQSDFLITGMTPNETQEVLGKWLGVAR